MNLDRALHIWYLIAIYVFAVVAVGMTALYCWSVGSELLESKNITKKIVGSILVLVAFVVVGTIVYYVYMNYDPGNCRLVPRYC